MIQHAFITLGDNSRIRIKYIEAWTYEALYKYSSYKFTFVTLSGNRIISFVDDDKKREIIDTLDNYSDT